MAISKRIKNKIKYRSGLEDRVIAELEARGIAFSYESLKIPYQRKISTYTPDIVLESGIIIEIKGLFDTEDRSKHLLIKEQHPELDIRFLFQKASAKIRKGSKTSYGDWCEKNGFLYAEGTIPDDWLPPKKKRRVKDGSRV